MIEFKSPCGHTVRARDEDAGKGVKCSYCGQEVKVPSDQVDDLDFLLRAAESDVSGERRSRRARRDSGPFLKRRPGETSPFDLILKLIYVAVAISAVAVVVRMVILPSLETFDREDDISSSQTLSSSGGSSSPRNALGLIDLDPSSGLYVSVVPEGATVFYVEGDIPRSGQRVSRMNGSRPMMPAGALPPSDRSYTVEVALPWNHVSLKRYPGYNDDFRRRLERTPRDDERQKLLEEYFLPDGADVVFVDQTEDQIYLVRQFHAIQTNQDQWKAIHAFYLPAQLSLERLLADYLPDAERYRFDEEHVRGELEYYNVPVMERTFVMEALKRVGAIPYLIQDPITQATQIRLFKIDVGTGEFRTQALR